MAVLESVSGTLVPAAESALPVADGRELGGRFKLLRALKKGQGVETLLGMDVVSGDPVVIKTACIDSLSVGSQMRLEHEAGVLSQIHSPWIAPLLHMGREDALLFLVLPLVPGITLEKRLIQGPLALDEAITVGRCILSALQEAHDHGVLHRDVKPANIIVGESRPLQQATLIDFGLARSAQLDASVREQPVGTARYMSPEQAGLLDQSQDERSDLYSAGILLFECLSGRVPFLGDSVGEVLRQHMTVRPPELRSLGVAIPRALDEIIQRLLRKDPRDRYQSAEAVLADLSVIRDALDRGVAEPALVVGLRDRRRTLTEPAFVGREEQLATLDRQLARARDGQGGLVLLEAESGGGKTRLLAELAQQSTRQGGWVLRGQGMDQTAQRPFQLLAGVAADLLTAARSDNNLAQALQKRLGDQREAVCAALPELADLLNSHGALALGPETFGPARTSAALAALLDALGMPGRPALILMDDCQWADELTLQLLKRWQTRREGETNAPRQVLLVAAFRSEEAGPNHVLRQLQPLAHIRLPPFEATDVSRLVESMAGPLPDSVVAAVQQLAGGSPFMAAAVLQGLVEAEALVAEPSGWRLEPSAMSGVASSRHAAAFLARRIERLPTEARRLLSAGAVLGKEFDLHFAATLAEQTPAQAIYALDEARHRQIVWIKNQDTRCAFIHDKLRQTLLERLGTSDRRELHHKAALYLEKQEGEHIFDLAYHFDAAGDSRHALHYALAAADQARAQHSLESAEQQYRIAERGSREAEVAVRYRIAEGLGEVLMLRGRYEESAEKLKNAGSLAQGDRAQAHIEGKLGELAFKRGDVKTARERIERALRLLGRIVPGSMAAVLVMVLWEVWVQVLHTLFPRLFLGRRKLDNAQPVLSAMRLYSRLAHLYWFHRGTMASLWAHLRELNLAERYPPTLELAQAYSEHAPAMSLIPYFRRGIAYAEKSLVIRKAFGDLWGQGQSLHFYGIILYASSRFAECIEKCREAVRLLERTGDQWEVNIARYQIAASLYRMGDLRGAVTEAQRMHQSGQELGDAQASGISLDTWARASLGKVPADLLRAELERPRDDVQATAQVLAAEAVRLLGESRPAEAVEALERGQYLVEQAGVKNAWVSPLLPWLATALRQELEKTANHTPGRRQALLLRSRRVVRRAVRIARSFQNELPHALREKALLLARLGRIQRARRFLNESLAVAERQGARYEYAQTLLARGHIGLEVGWSAAADDVNQAKQQLRALESPVGTGEETGRESAQPITLSLADRFESVLDVGRRIASALSRDTIFGEVREASLRLLRGERCMLIKLVDQPDGEEATLVSGELEGHFSNTMVRRALDTGRAVAFVEGMPESTSESLLLTGVRSSLCAPIFVRGKAIGCIYVSHRQVAGLFGEDEERLADFISTIAGAALENAEGFTELRRLNESLELRIAERKQAEKQIQEQAALLDKARDAISVQDLTSRILFWNQSAERLYGWLATEALGKNAEELLMKGADERWREAVQTLLASGEWTGELHQVTKSGKEVIVESRWTLVRDDNGNPKSRLVVDTDITEKKRLEAQFLRAQRMESLGTLASGIAHDINNVLTPITMSIDLLRQEVPKEMRRTILDELEIGAQRGAEMVKRILSFAKGTDGQRVDLHLKKVVEELERMLRRTFPRSTALRAEVPDDLWLVSGDATQLYQLLMNLCVNARDAMPEGGTCTIAAANTVLTEQASRIHPDARAGSYVLLTVTDTGTGIPPDVLEKIFNPFFTTKEYGKGTGLGLATVLGIVKGHGGFLTVSSNVGEGTQFAIYLPTTRSETSAAVEAKPTAPISTDRQLILVVDDEPIIRHLIRRNLEANNYEVMLAGDGAEAVRLFGQHREKLRLVLTDMMMPVLDGPSTIRALQELDPKVRIIAFSGVSPCGLAADAAKQVNAFLMKPFTSDKLLKTVHDVLQAN